jgi:hypothetical protein
MYLLLAEARKVMTKSKESPAVIDKARSLTVESVLLR